MTDELQVPVRAQRMVWIDFAKLVAIIGVMVDHSLGLLYSSELIRRSSSYSVSLFIILMGVTCFQSFDRSNAKPTTKIWGKCKVMLRQYIIATAVYCCTANSKLVLEVFFSQLIHFNAAGPLYYVSMYLQLLIVSPVLYAMLLSTKGKKNELLIDFSWLLLVGIVSLFTTDYSLILDIYGGGGKLFGGTYLILMYLGMCFGKYYNRISLSKRGSGIAFAVFTVLAVAWGKFVTWDWLRIDSYIPYGEGRNPPSVSLCLYAILIAIAIYSLGVLLSYYPKGIPSKAFNAVSIVGRHTLYIFLYHTYILCYILPRLDPLIGSSMLLKNVVYYAVMISGSITVEYVFEEVHKLIAKAYSGREMVSAS